MLIAWAAIAATLIIAAFAAGYVVGLAEDDLGEGWGGDL